MTKEDAVIIKEWRTNGATWRRIAEYAADKWPDMGYIAGHQLEGRELCDEAARTLGDDRRDQPWN